MKVGAAVAVARRGGVSATYDELNKYFAISGMPIATGQYWNAVYGREKGEAAQDEEGMQTMRTLARNMVFLMRSIALGKEQYGVPQREPFQRTNLHPLKKAFLRITSPFGRPHYSQRGSFSMKTVSKEEYQRRLEQASPPSPVGKDCLLAFLFGGRHLHLGPGAVQPLPKPGPGAAPSPHRGVHQPDFPLRAAHRLGPLRQNRPARRGGHAGAHHGPLPTPWCPRRWS